MYLLKHVGGAAYIGTEAARNLIPISIMEARMRPHTALAPIHFLIDPLTDRFQPAVLLGFLPLTLDCSKIEGASADGDQK